MSHVRTKGRAIKGNKLLFWKKWLKQLDMMNDWGHLLHLESKIFSLKEPEWDLENTGSYEIMHIPHRCFHSTSSHALEDFSPLKLSNCENSSWQISSGHFALLKIIQKSPYVLERAIKSAICLNIYLLNWIWFCRWLSTMLWNECHLFLTSCVALGKSLQLFGVWENSN